MSPRHLRHRHAGRSGLPADRALLLGAPVAIPAPTRHQSRQRSVHYLQWAPSPTSAFMIDVEARSARAGSPDAHLPLGMKVVRADPTMDGCAVPAEFLRDDGDRR